MHFYANKKKAAPYTKSFYCVSVSLRVCVCVCVFPKKLARRLSQKYVRSVLLFSLSISQVTVADVYQDSYMQSYVFCLLP